MLGPNAERLAEIVGGSWEGTPEPGWRYSGLCYFRPMFKPGDVVVAVSKGWAGVRRAQQNPDAFSGAPAAIAQRGDDITLDCPVLRVPHIGRAIRALASYTRSISPSRYFAVTGSVGKSTTTLLLQHALAGQGTVATTNGGKNNLRSGVSLTTAQSVTADFSVCEVSHAALPSPEAQRLRPDVAIITAIAIAHGEEIGTLEDVAVRKSHLLKYLNDQGLAVLNRDMPHFDLIADVAASSASRTITYGRHPESEFRFLHYDRLSHSAEVEIRGERATVRPAAPGEHVVMNALGVLAAIDASGLDWRAAAKELETGYVPPRRGQQSDLEVHGKAVRVIDDSHNANPMSMRASIQRLSTESEPRRGRSIAVLSDMLELGSDSPNYHRDLAPFLEQASVDQVFTAGPLMKFLHSALPEQMRGGHADSAQKLRPLLAEQLQDHDTVLFKGSKATGLFKIPAAWRRQSSRIFRDPAELWYSGSQTRRSVQQRSTPSLILVHQTSTRVSVDPDVLYRPCSLVRLMWEYLLPYEALEEADPSNLCSVAVRFFGDEERLLHAMNQAARQLGMSRTRFSTLHGLAHDKDIITARDLDLLQGALTEARQRAPQSLSFPRSKPTAPQLVHLLESLAAHDYAGVQVQLSEEGCHLSFSAQGRQGHLRGTVLGTRNVEAAVSSLKEALAELQPSRPGEGYSSNGAATP